MKLLIITQVIDTEHPILGFFHRWVEEFAKHAEHVHVICLQVGKHSLPTNVTVHSLGKEAGVSKLTYLWRFYSLIWQFRHEYDAVFVHMNQIYVILGAPLWRLMGKRVGLWYMHGAVSVSLRIAERLTHIILTGSKDSFKINSTKVVVTGHGIDIERFAAQTALTTRDLTLITVGRITKVKNIHTLLKIFAAVYSIHEDATLTIVGSADSPIDQAYAMTLRTQAEQLGVSAAVHWYGRVTQSDLPALLARAKVFVTTAQNGSLDKTILEAMAIGLPVVSMAPGSASLPLGTTQTTSEEACVEAINTVLESGINQIEGYQKYIIEHHSLQHLIPRIIHHLS